MRLHVVVVLVVGSRLVGEVPALVRLYVLALVTASFRNGRVNACIN
jgi:hypothetical protein